MRNIEEEESTSDSEDLDFAGTLQLQVSFPARVMAQRLVIILYTAWGIGLEHHMLKLLIWYRSGHSVPGQLQRWSTTFPFFREMVCARAQIPSNCVQDIQIFLSFVRLQGHPVWPMVGNLTK